jgi:S-adenosylmethionine:tRNA ribosyltransferase-isomerase
LLVVSCKNKTITHDYFYNLPRYLNPDDLVVFNDTKVFPARLIGRKESGGRVEILLLKNSKVKIQTSSEIQNSRCSEWEFLGRNIGGARRVIFDEGLVGEIENNKIIFNVSNSELMRLINKIGYTPLPPYINVQCLMHNAQETRKVREQYQTVYAKNVGSAAAPTAGFHFTTKLIKRLNDLEIKQAFVTLHVGLGTFLPVKTENIEEHKMHSEYFRIDQEAITKMQTSKRAVAVGTTTVRVLETWASTGKTEGETEIFIYPGYKFKVVDALITNFHLPKSTLLMLVCAFAGKDLIMKAYQEAIREKYRFFSFGDAMLII